MWAYVELTGAVNSCLSHTSQLLLLLLCTRRERGEGGYDLPWFWVPGNVLIVSIYTLLFILHHHSTQTLSKVNSKVLFWAPSRNFGKRLLASSCPSVCLHGTTQLPLDGFSWNFIFEFLRKYGEIIQVSLKFDTIKGYFTWRPECLYDNISLNSS